ncbi:hypothetical protein [Mesorhizobium sp. LSJC280B00]|uniref:hypothetical protein n=1 Tax=Mesorhizobium sp. LSJC280B00 TaxID=1287336 RepID=UPI0003CEC775|nr:hypothetical protein [Mesorhizobium sp. LSJC280B00]ESW82551.1 hypothetical protein X772_20885 [Mesorhizobium sp. LSJC280B00]
MNINLCTGRLAALAILSIAATAAQAKDGNPLADMVRAANSRFENVAAATAMYEPMADGTLKLIAVEYITSKGPASLDGHLFNFNSAPNRYGLGPFYELHVWAWKGNPTGAFADMNPNVSCDAMKGM